MEEKTKIMTTQENGHVFRMGNERRNIKGNKKTKKYKLK